MADVKKVIGNYTKQMPDYIDIRDPKDDDTEIVVKVLSSNQGGTTSQAPAGGSQIM